MRTLTFFLFTFGLLATYYPSSSEVAKEYMIFPKNRTDEDAFSKTEESIKKVTESEEVYSLRDVDKELIFWVANVTSTQLSKIREDSGVLAAEENVIGYEEGAALLLPTTMAHSSTSIPTKVKRDVAFATQTDASDELVVISQPDNIPNLDDLANPDDYVYDSRAGEGIFIYSLERGIDASKTDEFPKDRTEFLQTELSREKQDPATDDSNDSHTAWILALQDIKDKQRTKKSIIAISVCSIDPVDPNNLSDARKEERDAIEEALKNDVPVLAAAGNKAEKKSPDGKLREGIDTAPAIYESPDFPIIVVGSTDHDGKRAATSQGGDKVTLLAQGIDIVCQGVPFAPQIKSGTSLATPQVADVLATFLAAGEPGIDTSTGNLAASAKKFLAEEASWVRTGGSRVVWNKVTEKDNPKKSESLPAPICAPKAEGKKVRDSHEEALIKAVGYFCKADAATTVLVGPELNRTVEVVIDGPANAVHYKAQDWSEKGDIDDVYFFTLTTVDDCRTPRNGYNLAKPLGDHTCNDILYRSWKDCFNEGRGGLIQAGCLVYSVNALF
ncbi:hypothetical protein H2201_001576 [Coniosporium apollinis]|uniref:Peptidase S8/S53 domain-containing protein n=1 Tax=Coniosporium apollinis TaxID=61459 RepID=A0ABQ9P0M0_9PEZI|nr:hypothetical protein H2201_001576 [Coniosporium apollinis]